MDPEVLKSCVPGCEEIEATGENEYTVGLAVRVGPVASRFTGRIVVSSVQPPDSYTLAFEGQAGSAGFGKGTAHVQLAPEPDGRCTLRYSAQVQVGGKIAQVGQRLVEGVARSMAAEFFSRLEQELRNRSPGTAVSESPLGSETSTVRPKAAQPAWWWWVGAASLLAIGIAVSQLAVR